MTSFPNIFFKWAFTKTNFWITDFPQPSSMFQVHHFNDWLCVNVYTFCPCWRALAALKVCDSKTSCPAFLLGQLGQELDSKSPAAWLRGQPTISLIGSNFICQPDGSERGLSNQLCRLHRAGEYERTVILLNAHEAVEQRVGWIDMPEDLNSRKPPPILRQEFSHFRPLASV